MLKSKAGRAGQSQLGKPFEIEAWDTKQSYLEEVLLGFGLPVNQSILTLLLPFEIGLHIMSLYGPSM